ncbi:hypothetical protein [Bartonella sp. LJL80]
MAKRWREGDGDDKRAEVAAEENQKPIAEASAAAAQQRLKQVDQTNVPASAAEIVKNQNVENNKETNITVGPTNVTVHTTETAQAIKDAVNQTTQKALEKGTRNIASGYDDGRMN